MRNSWRMAIMGLVAVPLVLLSAPQTAPTELGAIQGVVKRSGTTIEPLANAQVTLEGGSVEPQVMQVLLNTAASQGIVVTPQPGASTSEIVQSLVDAAVARGFPLTTANIQSQLSSLSGRTPPTTTTDRDGNFAFREVRPGQYTVRVQRDGFFGKPEGGINPPTAAIDVAVAGKETKSVELSMMPGAIIGGRIFGVDGQLMSNANVQAFTMVYQTGFAVMAPLVSKVTDDRGEYRLFWVPPGDYYIGVTPRPSAASPGAGVPPPSIKSQLSPDGASSKIPAYALVATRSATVGQDGTFLVPAIPEGHYRIGAVAGLTPELYLADVRQNGQSVFDSGFDVGARSPDPIEVVIGAGAGTVDGLVLESPLKPSAGATVALVPEARRHENRALYLAATTDALGRFRIRGVAPGSYKVFAWESVRALAFQNPGFLAKYEDVGKIVTVGQGTTANTEITVIPAVEKK